MSHGDYMEKVPEGFALVAHSDACPNVAICDESRGFYGVQYHPEVNHTEHGTDMIRNFLYEVCGAEGDWTMGDYKETAIRQIREKVGGGKVLLALSGGVDSSVAAALLAEAVGSQLTCVFVDHGLMRLNEGDEVEEAFKKWDINFVRANAEELFLSKLSGVSEPERKRKIIGEEFIRVFEEEAKKIGRVDYLVQGTIYPDVIESGAGDAAVIKSHHNVGGLPDYVDFKEIIEPLRMLFKDEVRQLGRELGLPEYLVMRQPFPGPGLAIRVIGEVTKDKLDTLRLADFIFRDEIAKAHLEGTMNQYFAVLTNMRSVGVMGDGRTYDYTLALRSVTTTDFMTADWTRIPYEVLDRISVRIVNEVPHINRIVYDITSKPPATIASRACAWALDTTVLCGRKILRRRQRILCPWYTPRKRRNRESREPCTLTLTDTAMRRAGLTRICGAPKGIRIEISASVSYGSSFPTDLCQEQEPTAE